MTRIIVTGITLVFLLPLCVLFYFNRPALEPTKEELQDSLQHAIGWLEKNRNEILGVDNYMLWYFLDRTVEITGNSTLRELVGANYERNIYPAMFDKHHHNRPWIKIFSKNIQSESPSIGNFPPRAYYEYHFAYAIHCDPILANNKEIIKQNDANFCGRLSVLRPTCTTHQLMGLVFLENSQCVDARDLNRQQEKLRKKIRHELALDFRPIDVYIQRLMMLAVTSPEESLRNVHIRTLLNTQNEDGGWGNFYPLVNIDSARYFGFGYGESKIGSPRAGKTFLKVFGVGKSNSTFHATAQAILLLGVLLDKN